MLDGFDPSGQGGGDHLDRRHPKPSSDVVPTSLRDLVGYRWALRCATRGASDTILGAGMATNGYTASDIAGDQRGVGYLIAEGELPIRLRSYYLSDQDLNTLATRAQALRGITAANRCDSCGATVTDLNEKRKGA